MREYYPTIALSASVGLVLVKKIDIIYCLSEGAYTNIYLVGGKKVTVAKNLKEVENALNDPSFERIHHSHLINLSHALRFVNEQYNYVLMANGEELSVSKSRKKAFLERFTKI